MNLPVYDFYCPQCRKIYRDIKILLSEKENFTADEKNPHNYSFIYYERNFSWRGFL